MTLTDQDRRDRIDATADILTDLGLPTLATRLRDVIDELLPPTTPARTPGQIAYEAWADGQGVSVRWGGLSPALHQTWLFVAQSVIAHHEQKPVRDERIKPTPDSAGQCGSVAHGVRCMLENGHSGSHLKVSGISRWEWEGTPTTAPSWSPVVGGWAEHREHGRVYVTAEIPRRGADSRWSVGIAGKSGGAWVDNHELSAPIPRVWESAEDVPAHVVVTDYEGTVWGGRELHERSAGRTWANRIAPLTEVLPVGGVW